METRELLGLELREVVKRLSFCEHCGFCRSTCPVVEFENNEESFSPRGRKTLFLAFMNGDLKPTARLSEKFYKCCTCSSCAYKCPQGINMGDISLLARQKLFELGLAPEPVKRLVENILEFKNVYMADNTSRNDWALYTDSDIKIKDSADVVYFVGCVTSFSGMTQTIAQAITSILNYLNEDWTLLKDEWCCGHPLYLAGDLRDTLSFAKHNVREILSVSPKKVITGCPGCYLALKYEYPRLLGIKPNFEVIHFVEFLEMYVNKERLKLPRLDTILTYHDPCELSRIGGLIREPRNVLSKLANVVYPEYNGVNSLCCGGGGLLKAIYPSVAEYMSRKRFEILMATKADLIVSACPTCLQNLLQTSTFYGNSKRIVDISQLVAEPIGLM